MAQTTGLELINEVEDRLGWSQSDTLEGSVSSDTRKLTRLLNRVLLTMQNLKDWPLLRTSSEIVLLAEYTDGTVDVTNDSKTVSGTGTAWDQTFKDRAFQVDGDEYVYRITSVESPTSMTLNRAYLGETETGASYTVVQDKYSLPSDFDRPVDDWRGFFAPYHIHFTSQRDMARMRRNESNQIRTGDPEYYTVEGLDDRFSARVVRFHPYPEDQRMVQFDYLRNHPKIEEDTDRILYPERLQDIVIDIMVDYAYRDYEDDQRMVRSLQDKISTINRGLSSNELTEEPIVLKPSKLHKRRELLRWSRGGRSRIDYGDYFDIIGFNKLR